MNINVDPKWTLFEAIDAAWEAYSGAGPQYGTTNRIRVLEQWGNLVGKETASSQLKEAIEGYPNIQEASNGLSLTVHALQKLKKSFAMMPETGVIPSHSRLDSFLNSIPSFGNLPELNLGIHFAPTFAKFLGYQPCELHFQYPIKELARYAYLDCVLMSVEEQLPEILFEFRRGEIESAIDHIQHFQSQIPTANAIVVSNEHLVIIVRNMVHRYNLGSVTESEADEMLRLLSRVNKKEGGVNSSQENPESGAVVLSKMIENVENATTNDQKKRTLEDLGRAIFACHQDILVKFTNLRTKSSEIDIVCEHFHRGKNCFLDDFGRYFIVECKNWNKPAGVVEIRDFIGKLSKTRVRLGIVLSKNGITGEANGGDALREIHAAYDREGLVIVTLTLADIKGITELVQILKIVEDKIDILRFDI
jgi:Restriction endonuclease